MKIIAILPLLLFLFFLSFIWRRRVKYKSMKFTYILLLSYTGILLLAFTIAPFIPQETSEETLEERSELYGDRLTNIDREDILLKKSFQYHEDFLDVSVTPANRNANIFIEKKNANDEKIEVTIIGGKLFIKDMDMSDVLKTPGLVLNDTKLSVHYPDTQEITVRMMEEEFVFTQFREKLGQLPDFQIENPIIYLKIPSNLKINHSPELYIEYR